MHRNCTQALANQLILRNSRSNPSWGLRKISICFQSLIILCRSSMGRHGNVSILISLGFEGWSNYLTSFWRSFATNLLPSRRARRALRLVAKQAKTGRSRSMRASSYAIRPKLTRSLQSEHCREFGLMGTRGSGSSYRSHVVSTRRPVG